MHTELHLHRTSGTCDTLQGLSPMSDVLLSYGLKGDVGLPPYRRHAAAVWRETEKVSTGSCVFTCADPEIHGQDV